MKFNRSKIMAVILSAILTFSLTACGAKDAAPESETQSQSSETSSQSASDSTSVSKLPIVNGSSVPDSAYVTYSSDSSSMDVSTLAGTVEAISSTDVVISDENGEVWDFQYADADKAGLTVGLSAVVTYTGDLVAADGASSVKVLSIIAQTPTVYTVTGVLSNGAMATFSLTDDATGTTQGYTITDETSINMENGRTDGERATVTYTIGSNGHNIALSMEDAD